MNKFFIPVIAFLLISCATQKKQTSSTLPVSLSSELHTAATKQAHIGFILKDISDDRIVFQDNADKNFIAASNIKLLNFLVGLNMLRDSVPSIQYIIKKDSLIIWPMADPSFLHSDFSRQKAFEFIKNSGKDIYIVSGRYKGQKYGNGWAWDDFNESFQPEITAFPIYGNVIKCEQDAVKGLKLSPDLASLYFAELKVKGSEPTIRRQVDNNNITIPKGLVNGYKQYIPIQFNRNIFESLLTDTLLATGMTTSNVTTIPNRPVPSNTKTIFNVSAMEVYEKMLQNSDNFLAEEMLLNYAAANDMEINSQKLIETAIAQYLSPDDVVKWVDGSGLSRLNLASPQSMVNILQKISLKLNNEKLLFSTLATGGKSGTLKNMFTEGEPFVFAKSGSMSGVYNLSGYLIGASGKKYAFSYMSNHFTGPVKNMQKEVEGFLNVVRTKY